MAESRYLILLSKDLGYMSDHSAAPLLAVSHEVERMLYGLRTSVEAVCK